MALNHYVATGTQLCCRIATDPTTVCPGPVRYKNPAKAYARTDFITMAMHMHMFLNQKTISTQ